MNRERAKELIPIIQAFANGREIQYRMHGFTEWSIVLDAEWNDEGDYRIKPLEFPPLPEGLEYMNHHGLSPGKFGDGWRPLVRGERLINGSQFWSTRDFAWKECFPNAIGHHPSQVDTCRTPISTPFPEPPKKKVMVPLGPEDVPPGSVLISTLCHGGWFAIQHVLSSGVGHLQTDGPHVSATHRSWEELRERFLIRRPGQDWQPCEKEAP